jgi:hypothetical protein
VFSPVDPKQFEQKKALNDKIVEKMKIAGKDGLQALFKQQHFKILKKYRTVTPEVQVVVVANANRRPDLDFSDVPYLDHISETRFKRVSQYKLTYNLMKKLPKIWNENYEYALVQKIRSNMD